MMSLNMNKYRRYVFAVAAAWKNTAYRRQE